jgi:hypothetical protein
MSDTPQGPAPSLFSPSDSASPTSVLPSLESLSTSSASDSASDDGSSATSDSEYVAPLSGHAPDPSIDGTSVTGGEGGVRVEKSEDVTEADRQVSSIRLPHSHGVYLGAQGSVYDIWRDNPTLTWSSGEGCCESTRLGFKIRSSHLRASYGRLCRTGVMSIT